MNIMKATPRSGISHFNVSDFEDRQVLTPKTCLLSKSEVDDILDWIKLNYETLMDLYREFENDEGDVIQTMQKLKKL